MLLFVLTARLGAVTRTPILSKISALTKIEQMWPFNSGLAHVLLFSCSSLLMAAASIWTPQQELDGMDTGGHGRKSLFATISLPQHEVFDTEATAAFGGLKTAVNSAQPPYTQNLYIFQGNQKVAQQLQGFLKDSSQRTILAFQETTNDWPNQSPQCMAIPPLDPRPHWYCRERAC